LVSDIKGGIYTEGVCKQGVEEDIWKEEGRKLHNEEIRDFYSSPSIIRMMK
jgi:hypothetical protein